MSEHDLVLDIRNTEGTFSLSKPVSELQIEAYAAGAAEPVTILLGFQLESGKRFFQSVTVSDAAKWIPVLLDETISGDLKISRPLLDDLEKSGLGIDTQHSLVVQRIRFR